MISRYSVKKPFTVLVGVLLVIVLGVVSLGRMTTDLLPDMSFQYALIVTTDMGASPQEVESDVTAPLEAAMATTSNIKNVSSMSYNSYSLVTCEYEQNANMDSVVIEMQQKIDQVKAGWKDGVGTPTIMKINPDMLPIMMTAVDMDGKSKSEITDFVENTLKPAIESTEGVASVTATGELTEQIQVTMNQAKIDALNEKINNAVSKKFDDAKSQMDDASAKIESGQNAITSASDQMSAGVDTLKEQKAKLAEQKTQLESTLSSLNEQKSRLETIQSALSDFMNSDTYTKTIPSLKEGANAPGEAGIALKAQLEQVDKQIATQFSGLSALGITVNTADDLPAAASAIAQTLIQVNTGIEQCQSGLDQIAQGEPSCLLDIKFFDGNDKEFVLANCGSVAPYFADPDNKEEAMKKIALMPHIFGEAGGASIQFISKPGDVTVARLFRSNGKYVLGCFEGTTKMYPLEKLKETTYCYPHAFVEAEADYEKFYEKINSNHLHMVYGKYAKVLKMFCEIVGIEYICFNK